MQNIKDRALVRMLACLDAKQRKGFREYLDCRLFNTNATLSHLYARIEAKALKNEAVPLSPKDFLKGTGVAESMLGKVFSQLLTLLNSYIALLATQNDSKAEHAATFQSWLEMGLSQDLLEREYKKMKRKFEVPASNELDIFHELRLETSYAKFRANLPRKDQSNLFEAHHELLESYYLVAKLKFLCASGNLRRIFREGERDASAQEFSDKVVAGLPAIGQAYYQAYKMLNQEPDLASAEKLFAFLQNEGAGFTDDDRRDLFFNLLNSSFPIMSQGNSEFESLVHRIYIELFSQGLIVIGGNRITGSNFKNMVSVKSRVGALQEARDFIENNQSLLAENEREALVTYCLGLVFFYEENYREAIGKFKVLSLDSPEDLLLGLNARNMLWKSYFEVYDDLNFDEHAEMHNIYHSFRVFVSRNSRISDYKKRCYLNFIRVFNRLVNIGDQSLWASTSEQLRALSAEVALLEEIVNKNWILAAIDKRIAQKEQ